LAKPHQVSLVKGHGIKALNRNIIDDSSKRWHVSFVSLDNYV